MVVISQVCESQVILDHILADDFAKFFSTTYFKRLDFSNEVSYNHYREKLRTAINTSAEAARAFHESRVATIVPESMDRFMSRDEWRVVSEDEWRMVLDKHLKSDKNFSRYYELRGIIKPWDDFFTRVTVHYTKRSDGKYSSDDLSQLKSFLDLIKEGKEVELDQLYNCLRNNDFHLRKEYQYDQVLALNQLAILRDKRSRETPQLNQTVVLHKPKEEINFYYLTIEDFFSLSPQDQVKCLKEADNMPLWDSRNQENRVSQWLLDYSKNSPEVANKICSARHIAHFMQIKDFVTIALQYEKSPQFPGPESMKNYNEFLKQSANISTKSFLMILNSKTLRDRVGIDVLEKALQNYAKKDKSIILKMGDIDFTESDLDTRLQTLMVEILFNGRQFRPTMSPPKTMVQTVAQTTSINTQQKGPAIPPEKSPETKRNLDKPTASTQAVDSQIISRASALGNEFTEFANNARTEVANPMTPALNVAKQRATDSRLNKDQSAIMNITSHFSTILDLKKHFTEKFNQKFPKFGIVTEMINPSDPKVGLALLTNPSSIADPAASNQTVKFCTEKPAEEGIYEFIFERNSAIKDPVIWEDMIEKTIRAAAEARALDDDSPIPYKNGTKAEVIKFYQVAKRMNIALEFDPASKAIVDEFEKNAKPEPDDAPTLGGKGKSLRG